MVLVRLLPRQAAPALISLKTSVIKNGAIVCRQMGTGTRAARGHGWYVNYRAGKGGRHLQGAYHDRESLEECKQWNEAVLQLGSTCVYMDIVVEPKKKQEEEEEEIKPDYRHFVKAPLLEELTAPKQRIYMDLATTVMPESTDNFLRLCDTEERGYKGSLLYRFEKLVGICGGDVLSNTGKTGLAAPFEYNAEEKAHPFMELANPLCRTIFNDPLALWHIPGTITMLVRRVNDVDSRFILLTEQAKHMDGIHRAIGQLRPKSLELIKHLKKTIIYQGGGLPVSYHLVVADCGVLENDTFDMATAA